MSRASLSLTLSHLHTHMHLSFTHTVCQPLVCQGVLDLSDAAVNKPRMFPQRALVQSRVGVTHSIGKISGRLDMCSGEKGGREEGSGE